MTKLGALKRALLLTCAVLPGVASAQEALPTVEVVGVSPVAGSEIDSDKVPSNVQSITAADLDHAKSPDLLDSIFRSVPGAYLSDQSGNQFQRNLDYRGFTASPVPGTPQSIAVYQNGTRINEAFGDIVNWDFIPEMAIARMTMMPNNPVFGLNAIGGALSIDMKNGFNYHGTEAELMGGSYGRVTSAAQAGYQNGNYSAYVAADATNDSGWRDFSSSSQLRRMYVDLGAKGDDTEFHVSFTGADNHLGAVAATPLQLLNQRWTSVYTWPQDTHLQLAFLQASATWKPTDSFSLAANAYYRGFWQSHNDGNGTDAQPCNDPTLLCIGDGMTPINASGPVTNTISPNAFLGEIDRNQTATNSYGGTLQGTSTTQLFDHDNHLVAGVSVDHGHTHFTGSSELGTVDQNLFVQGTGVFIDQPADDIQPPNLLATNTYLGIYATDTFDVTSQLSVTAGGRYNLAQIQLQDESGLNPLLDGNDQYTRFNPVIGMTYKVTPNLTAYAGYSEANRAPTPLELGCASPTTPCQIDNFLIADPPLKQVVSHTYEAGLRGSATFGGAAPLVTKEKGTVAADSKAGQLSWSLGVFRTENTDDIINIASTAVPMFGYFQNAGETLRQGIEAKINYQQDRWTVYANYTYVDATYQSYLTLQSPNNPFADPATGTISVAPGDHIPAIPANRFKAGAEYQITDAWKLGADLNVVGSQYLIHDDANQNPMVPAYWVVNMHTSYQLTRNIELFGLVQNLFNQHYYSAGTFASVAGLTGNGNPTVNLATLNDPRTFLPGMPLAIYGGIKVKFDPSDPQAQGSFNMASLPVKAPVAAAVDRWTGAYAGGNAGWLGSTHNSISNSGTDDGTGGLGTALATGAIPTSVGLGTSGALLGGTTGYNWRLNPMWVAGIETDFDAGLTKKSTTIGPVTIPGFAPQTTTFTRDLDWLGTFRGRVGVTPTSPLLVYATAGLAYGETKLGSNYICPQCSPAPIPPPTTSNTSFGWTAGAGVEWAFAPQWSAKAEYLYVDLGSINNFISYGYNFANGGNSSTMTSTARETENIVRFGVNYKITAGL
ncbi:TonB-dependent receptor domain-containing protein [Bradyrhizobium sp.]|uniref:TonB-dependent receptor domain-containing protein n=1 Tax=Bradyrhizobium sp. TaxID=376 RepID=UPI003C39C59D